MKMCEQAIGCCFAISALVQCGCNDERRERNMGNLTSSLVVETEALREALSLPSVKAAIAKNHA
jgi:hypothetical protein